MDFKSYVIREVYENNKCYLIEPIKERYDRCFWKSKFIYREGDNLSIETVSNYISSEGKVKKKTIEPKDFHSMAGCYDYMINYGLSDLEYSKFKCTEYPDIEPYLIMRELTNDN